MTEDRRRGRRLPLPWWWDMCPDGWGKVLCVLDVIAHRLHLPYRLIAPVCDAHDRRLMAVLPEEWRRDP